MATHTHPRALVRVLIPAAFAATVLAFGGCKPAASASHQPPPPAVTVAPAEQRDITEWDEFTGRAEAVESVEVRPRVSGHIQEVRFQAGQIVKKGDVLFVIDPRYYKAELDRSTADYQQAKVRVANALREATRSRALLASRTISSEQADAIESTYEQAEAALTATQAIMDRARLDYDFTQVRAPIDGRVSRALLTVGNYVSGNPGGASLLTTLVSVDPVFVYADVDEHSLLRFNALAGSRGSGKVPVELELADESGYPHHGYIESFDNRLDPNTGTIVLRAVFPNSDGRIVPGLFARIRIPTVTERPAVLVDETAIGTDQARKFVLTLGEGNTAQYRQVELGPIIDGKRIVLSGLQPGEMVIINGLMRTRPGTPVTPQERVADAPAHDQKTARR